MESLYLDVVLPKKSHKNYLINLREEKRNIDEETNYLLDRIKYKNDQNYSPKNQNKLEDISFYP